MEDQTADRGRRVDVLGKWPETRPLGLNRVNNVEEIAQGASEPIVLRDGDDIAGTQLIEHPVELGS